MKLTITPSRSAAMLAGLGLSLLLLPVLPSRAQGGPGGGAGGFGGGRRPAPFAAGTVTAVDPAASTITITSQNGGASQTIQTLRRTQISLQSTATVADLKVGDQVQVQGVPTGITASSLTMGASPIPAGRGGFGGGRGGAPGAAGAAATAPPAYASATGTVASLDPLTITLSGDATLTLKMAATAKVMKFAPIDISAIKTGQTIVAFGQTGDDGTLTATSVGVNVDPASLGGFGGRGGRGGFGGGPGGFGGGPGGFGSRGGGQGGQNQAPPAPDAAPPAG